MKTMDVYNALLADDATDRRGLHKKHVTFLGHDLNAESVASLKPDAAKLNEKVKELSAAIDRTISVANTNIGALRPR
jgi:hypothetical protein